MVQLSWCIPSHKEPLITISYIISKVAATPHQSATLNYSSCFFLFFLSFWFIIYVYCCLIHQRNCCDQAVLMLISFVDSQIFEIVNVHTFSYPKCACHRFRCFCSLFSEGGGGNVRIILSCYVEDKELARNHTHTYTEHTLFG